MQPEFDTNPLRDQIMLALGVKDEDWMNFQTYIEVVTRTLTRILTLSPTLSPTLTCASSYLLSGDHGNI